MIKKLMTLSALLLASAGAAANGWDIEAGFENQNFNDIGAVFKAVAVTGGYRVDFEDDLSGTFEAGVAFGLNDDNVGAITTDMGTTLTAGYRVTKLVQGNVSIFARVLYSRADGSTSNNPDNVDLGVDDNGLGFGAGIMVGNVVLGGTIHTGALTNYRVLHLGYRWRL